MPRRHLPVVLNLPETPVRIEQTIHGRAYMIEVSFVSRDRWRAQIARVPGGCGALMPFYGATVDEATERLTGWLERAWRQVR